MATRTLTLFLPGYLHPSLNAMLQRHWRVNTGMKQKAARALLSALVAAQARPSLRDERNLSAKYLIDRLVDAGAYP